MNPTFQNILNSLGGWALRAVGFLAILIVGWFLSRIIGRIVDRLLNAAGFNRLAQQTKFRRWTGSYEPSVLVGRIVYYVALLFTFQIAFSVFGPNPVSTLINTIILWLPRLLVAAVIVVVAIAIANAVFDIVGNALSQFSYGRWLGRAAQIVIVVLGLIAALNQIGVATSVTLPVLIAGLATIGGVIVVGVGGGLIQPMRQRWERVLDRAESETSRVTTHLRTQAEKDAKMKDRDDRLSQPAYTSASADRDIKDTDGKGRDIRVGEIKARPEREAKQGRGQSR